MDKGKKDTAKDPDAVKADRTKCSDEANDRGCCAEQPQNAVENSILAYILLHITP